MPRYPKKSTLFPTQQTFPCPVAGCRTQVRSSWGFSQHVNADHRGMDLQYPGNEGDLVQFPSSDIVQTSSPQLSPNAFSSDHFGVYNWDPFDFDLDGRGDASANPSESDLESVPADSTEFHPLINGMLSITLFYNF